ncbi:MAG: LysR family transcriptional regulator [Oleispira sp.]
MDRFSAMQIFVRIVQLGSFTAVANEMAMTQSAVSKKIAALEDTLAAKLLNRSSRKVVLTEVGSNYFEHCLSILAEVEEAESQASEYTLKPKGLLKVNVPLSFGQLHVMPHLPKFMRMYPDIQLDLTLLDRRTDIITEGVDVAIRIGELNDSSLVAKKLGITRRALVASPEYLKQRGMPTSLEELKQHNCLVNSHHASIDTWYFHYQKKEVTVQVNGSMRANTGYALKDWAIADMGITILPTWLIADELENGCLVEVLSDYVPTVFPINALYPQKHYMPLKVRCFEKFFREIFASEAEICG